MKTSKMFFLVLVAVTSALVGCGTPKVLKSQTVSPPVYIYGQEPSKRELEDGGRQFQAHARAMQDERLRHERVMARIEFQAEEARLAADKGLQVQPAGQTSYFQQPFQQYQGGAAVYQQPQALPVASNSAPVYAPEYINYPGTIPYYPANYYGGWNWGGGVISRWGTFGNRGIEEFPIVTTRVIDWGFGTDCRPGRGRRHHR